MAAAKIVHLLGLLREQCATIEQNADNPAALTKAFIALANCMEDYFVVSTTEVQSPEIRESMRKFAWSWVELAEFPMRQLLPAAAKALQRFPSHKGLVMVIADWCLDACKQNMQAKMEAMQCGILQGLCLAACHLWQGFSYEEEDYLLAGRIFEAMRLASEPPGVKFYLLPYEVKDEFYEIARKGWQGVNMESVWKALEGRHEMETYGTINHGLLLGAYFLKYFPDEDNMVQYLEVLKSLAEAFAFVFPGVAIDKPFQGFLKATLEEAKDFGVCQKLFDEVLLILRRTLDPSKVPYDETKPHLLPALNRQLLADFKEDGNRPVASTVVITCHFRRDARRAALEAAERYAEAEVEAGPDSSPAAEAPKANEAKGAEAEEDSTSKPEKRPKTRTCAKCSKEQKEPRAPGESAFKKCSRCRSVYYCGSECQKMHWKDHKLVCTPS